MGVALMGRGASGRTGRRAAEKAISSPLLEDVSIRGARGILINITRDVPVLSEVNDAASLVGGGVRRGEHHLRNGDRRSAGDEVKVTVVATGSNRASRRAC